MWDNVDKSLEEYYIKYLEEQIDLKDSLQNTFNSINNLSSFDEIKNVSKDVDTQRFKRYIEKEKDNIPEDSYLYYLIVLYLAKKKIKNDEMLKLLIYLEYYKSKIKLDGIEEVLFKDIVKDAKEKSEKEISKLPNIKPIELNTIDYILLGILAIPNNLGYIWEDYKESITKYNAEELERLTLSKIASGEVLNIDDFEYTKLLEKQRKRQINIHDGIVSGAIENEVDNIFNQTKLEVGKEYGIKKCKFIAVEDKKTTKMCESLNNQVFLLDDYNTYQRYSESDGRVVTYTTYGLVVGDNLPPIDNHFHYCRSTITYQTDMKYVELLAEYNDLKSKLPNDIPETLEEYGNMRYNIDNFYRDIMSKKSAKEHYDKYFEYGERKNKISFETYYDGYINAVRILANYSTKEIGKIRGVSYHFYDRMIDRNIDIKQIVNLLTSNIEGIFDKKNNSYDYKNEDILIGISVNSKYLTTTINYSKQTR